MKKIVLFLSVCLACVPALAKDWDWEFSQLDWRDDVFYTPDNKPVNGVVKSDLYGYYTLVDAHDGKLNGQEKLYGVNGNYIGIVPDGASNESGEKVVDRELYDKVLVDFIQDAFLFGRTKAYVSRCAAAYLNALKENSTDKSTMNCVNIDSLEKQDVFGRIEDFRVSKRDQKVVVEIPFVPVKFRES